MRIGKRHLLSCLVSGCLLVFAAGVLSASAQTTAPNEWTWVGGAQATTCSPQTCNQNPIYGTFGVLAAGNDPGSGGGATWTDNDGNFWLFAGALWEFNPTTKEWGWMAPSDLFECTKDCDDRYGTLGVPSVVNLPTTATGAVTWKDKGGNLWLFGGSGTDIEGNLGFLNALWKFIPSTGAWGWMSGSDLLTCAGNPGICGVPGVYGTLGTPAPGNSPGGRTGSMDWADSSGHLWLFGGQGNDDSTPLTMSNQGGILNDFWRFDPATSEWTWMGGNNSIAPNYFEPGVYGTLGTPSAANIPSSRTGGATWADSGGHFWLFGGEANLVGNPNSISAGTYVGGTPNDLWEFDPSTLEWTWMGGSDVGVGTLGGQSPPGVYGTLGVPAAGNIPGGRSPAAFWTDSAGSFWLFGGFGYDGAGNYGYLNDLWEFNPSTMLWAWMGGSSTIACLYTQDGNECAPQGAYGTLGTAAAGNVPGGRTNASSWVDLDGNLWLRGGSTYDWTLPAYGPGYPPGEPAGVTQGLDDLWEYRPATNSFPPAATPVFSLPSGDYQSSQTLTISNGMTNANIYYTADGSTPTSGSTLYNGPITVSSTETVQAIAIATGYPASGLASATYNFKTYSPTFSQPSGIYSASVTVTISDVIASAAIYYTTDGSTPTSSSTQYSLPITVSTSETVKAIAVFNGYNSDVVSATYTFSTSTFSIATAPASMTVSAGGSGTTVVTVTPANGFNSAVAFTCTGLPSGATYSFSPATVTPSGSAAATTTLTVSTTSTTAALHRTPRPLFPGAELAVTLCCIGWKKRRRLQMLLMLAACAAGLGLLSACGGGGSSGGGGGGSQPVTSTVTVTATSGSLQQSTTFTLTVN